MIQKDLEERETFLIHFHLITSWKIVVTGPFIAKSSCWNDDGGCLNILVQNPTSPKENEFFHPKLNQILYNSHTGSSPNWCIKDSNLLVSNRNPIDNDFKIGHGGSYDDFMIIILKQARKGHS